MSRAWLLFALASLMTLGFTGGLGVHAWRADTQQQRAEQLAIHQSQINDTLWQLDSRGMLLLTQLQQHGYEALEALELSVLPASEDMLSHAAMAMSQHTIESLVLPQLDNWEKHQQTLDSFKDNQQFENLQQRVQVYQGQSSANQKIGINSLNKSKINLSEVATTTPLPTDNTPWQVSISDDFWCFFQQHQPIRNAWQVPHLEMLKWLTENNSAAMLPSSLVPVDITSQELAQWRLASLPIALAPTPLPPLKPRLTTVRIWVPLGVLCVILALASSAGLLAQAQMLHRRQREFVATLTHELRTPLATLRLHNHLLSHPKSEPQQRDQYSALMEQESARMARLIDNCLIQSRLDRGVMQLDTCPVSLQDLFERAWPTLTSLADRYDLAMDLPDLADLSVMADTDASLQILTNLVDNACKYAAQGKRLQWQCKAENAQVILSLHDYGPGLSSQAARHLFKAFCRDDAHATEEGTPGVGLGLSLCRRLARAQGGDLTYAKSPEGGCIFTLHLQRARG